MPEAKPRAIANEDDLIQICDRSPIITSLHAGWNGIFLGHFRTPAYETPEVCSPFWHGLLIFPKTEAPIQARRTLDGRIHHERVVEGDIVITPAQVGHRSCWNAEHDFIVIAIASDVFARAVDESAEPSNVELVPHFATSDGLVLQIGLALKGVLENNPQGSRLYAETMANALAVHLLQHYSARQPILRDYNGGLSRHQLRQVIDYINGPHIQRIEEVNPRLNAVIIPLFDQARAQAQAADEARSRRDTLRPLHGVPITIKESFDVAGTVSNMGISALSQTAKQDAPLVKRLQQAGAIILGKTNVAQLLASNESDNPVYGRTLNPWNPERSPGGSSGGEAAIIAASGSYLGLGSDIGGSVRMPAHACGICSLKPTSSRLSMVGHVPLLPGQEAILAQPGPMARTVADLNLAMKVMAAPGQEAFDPSIPPVPWREPSDVKLENLRIAFFTDNGIMTPSPAVRRAVREAALSLLKRGAIVEEWTPPDLLKALQLYFQLYGADGGVTSKRQLGNSKTLPQLKQTLQTISAPKALLKVIAAISGFMGQPLIAKLFPYIGEVSVSDYWRTIDERNRYRAAFIAAMEAKQFDAILSPVCALPALTHGSSNFLVQDATYTIPYNLLGMPAGVVSATRVRLGEESDSVRRSHSDVSEARRSPGASALLRSADRAASTQLSEQTASKVEQESVGLPVGVQVAARHWREDIVLAVMAAIEEHFQSQPDYPVHLPV